jgi:16S rRNA (guanine527-N7)-methyltransferase
MKEQTRRVLGEMGLEVREEQLEQFAAYHALLCEWNEKMNLTAITEGEEVARKHFADSLLPLCFDLIPQNSSCIDVGTGAGFPGIPLLIMRPDLQMVLLDSLAKRLKFLEAVCGELGVKAQLVHARAEEGGRKEDLREQFDLVVSRAVAPAAVLLELTVPFLKKGGCALSYKGPAAREEFAAVQGACRKLGADPKVLFYEKSLPWGKRCLAGVKKCAPTPKAYPRQPGTPGKKPLQ